MGKDGIGKFRRLLDGNEDWKHPYSNYCYLHHTLFYALTNILQTDYRLLLVYHYVSASRAVNEW